MLSATFRQFSLSSSHRGLLPGYRVLCGCLRLYAIHCGVCRKSIVQGVMLFSIKGVCGNVTQVTANGEIWPMVLLFQSLKKKSFHNNDSTLNRVEVYWCEMMFDCLCPCHRKKVMVLPDLIEVLLFHLLCSFLQDAMPLSLHATVRELK